MWKPIPAGRVLSLGTFALAALLALLALARLREAFLLQFVQQLLELIAQRLGAAFRWLQNIRGHSGLAVWDQPVNGARRRVPRIFCQPRQ